ncbi:hypothetical protein B0H14DRAFT_2648183 [Mycena olivaceomarginata]|nr:hypothetical protein B0H14DRAFT_2648183 [Mycena olivaceomarginata]
MCGMKMEMPKKPGRDAWDESENACVPVVGMEMDSERLMTEHACGIAEPRPSVMGAGGAGERREHAAARDESATRWAVARAAGDNSWRVEGSGGSAQRERRGGAGDSQECNAKKGRGNTEGILEGVYSMWDALRGAGGHQNAVLAEGGNSSIAQCNGRDCNSRIGGGSMPKGSKTWTAQRGGLEGLIVRSGIEVHHNCSKGINTFERRNRIFSLPGPRFRLLNTNGYQSGYSLGVKLPFSTGFGSEDVWSNNPLIG